MQLRIQKAISRASTMLYRSFASSEWIDELCTIIISALRFPDIAAVRIAVGNFVHETPGFLTTKWTIERTFTVPRDVACSIVVVYRSIKNQQNSRPFIKDEEEFLDSIVSLIVGFASKKAFDELHHEHVERKKELSGISRIIEIFQKAEPFEQLLKEVVEVLPPAWQYPLDTGARIVFGSHSFATSNFQITPWMQRQEFQVPQGVGGVVEICYVAQHPDSTEGPFLKEERTLIENIARLIVTASGSKLYEHLMLQNRERLKELHAINQTTRIIGLGNSVDETLHQIALLLPGSWLFPEDAEARILFERKEYVSRAHSETPWVMREPFITFDNLVGSIEVYYLTEHPAADEGPFLKEERDLIRNIARLIAHFLNNDKGRNLVEQTGKQRDAQLPVSPPVPECKKPLIKLLNTRAYEQQRVRSVHKYRIRQVLLVSSTFDAFSIYFDDPYFERLCNAPQTSTIVLPRITLVCSWSHAQDLLSKEGFDLVVLIPGPDESKAKTICNECRIALPDTHMFVLINQRRQLTTFGESILHGDPHQRLFAWPGDARIFFAMVMLREDAMNVEEDTATGLVKIVLIVEDSPEFYSRLLSMLYPSLMAVGHDQFFLGAAHRDVTSTISFRPIVLLAHNYEDAMHYFNKYSSSLLCCITDVEFEICGTMDKQAGLKLAHAIRQRQPGLPCLLHSSEENHAAAALDAGVSFISKTKSGSIETIVSFVKESLSAMEKSETGPNSSLLRSIVSPYEEATLFDPGSVVTLCGGSLGGKGRGAAFLSTLLAETPAKKFPADLRVLTPVTALIGTDESARILALPSVKTAIDANLSYSEIRKLFASIQLDPALKQRLRNFVEQVRSPLAVRSSGLFEDSLSQPFAGAFETYLIPNNHFQSSVRADQLEQAILQVYASLFRPEARSYFELAGRKPQDELMAVVLQEVVGTTFDNFFYPHISGVARSFNFYPIASMKPDEGVAVAALGLGIHVVEGHASHRFSPRYPAIEFGSLRNLMAASQTSFFAINLAESNPDIATAGEKAALSLLDLKQAEQHGALLHIASVYDPQNERIVPGLTCRGPRIINFADILKYDYVPLAPALDTILGMLADELGSPVEIEFAATLPTKEQPVAALYLLQVRPLIGETNACDVTTNNTAKIMLMSNTALGNGSFGPITDVVIVNPNQFDRLHTQKMVDEVDYFNRKLVKAGKNYLLIGPGRWGTRDPSLGIGVSWNQISGAKVLVEVGLTDFQVDASLGSHFFHNLISMNVGYIAVNERSSIDTIFWDTFATGEVIEVRNYFRHIQFSAPLSIRIDGRKGVGVISSE